VEKLQQELVVFGRIDDDQPWRVGLYGIDQDGDQLVIDWRAPFAGGFYQARLDDPMGLDRRVTYVGSITDLFIEEFTTGEIRGSSPLIGELSRSRGTEMRAAVATLQSEQDALVRLDPTARLVLRGGPGTGKTVVGLHRAAWLVYNDRRLTAGRILVIGPSDKFLRFVSAVLPTLGEARIVQTTFERLLGRSTAAGSDPRWLDVLDRFEAGLLHPGEIQVGLTRIRVGEVTDLLEQIGTRTIPWRDRRKAFVNRLAAIHGLKAGDVSKAAADVWPTLSTDQAMRRLRSPALLTELGMDVDLIDAWLADPVDGALLDEVRARVEGVPATYGHVIVDEAQDLSLLQLRAVQRRSAGITLVGDDAQRSAPHGLGLRGAAVELEVEPAEMATAYRMSAEIADWLNEHAAAHGIDAVELLGIRPTGISVDEVAGDPATAKARLAELAPAWPNTALITAEDTWIHKGVEYDAVVVDTSGMDPAQIYLAASRAAHRLVVIHPG
jgi:DNA helicase IV